ncbi:hypothetical protein ACLB6G_05725 [Zhengella sp. ZM62]|uniref:hypothetical protein n=1 Tax=Zhengella sedimenti TaxID=3390035 RepID=UPI00397511E6
MASRLFSKVSPAIWSSPRFRKVSAGAQISLFYLMTNAHVDSTGCYRLPVGYACADTGQDADTWQRHIGELCEADLILVDEAAEYVLIRRWFKHNPPMSLDHLTGTKRRVAEIESDPLREACEEELAQAEAELLARLEAKAKDKPRGNPPSKRNVSDLVTGAGRHLMETGYMGGRGR